MRMFPPGGNKHQVESQSLVGAAAKLAGERVNGDGGRLDGLESILSRCIP